MKNKTNKITLLFGAVMVIAVVAGVVAFSYTTSASAKATVSQAIDTGFLAHRGGRGLPGDPVAGNEYLAEALGISVEELEDAQQAARDAAIQMAVDQELITQEQADAMLLGEFGFRHGFDGFKGGWFGHDNNIDHESLLADALGINVEEFQKAREEAQAAGLAQAIEAGHITQEQAELILAMQALKSYIDPQALFAEALGISSNQLQAYRDEGLSISEILNELGISAVDVREAAQVAHENAIQQAIQDGVITQEQADQLQNGAPGMHGGIFGRGFGGRDGMLPPDGAWDGIPKSPGTSAPNDSTDTSL